MAEGFRAWVDSEEFARIMTNALAFFPARSPVKHAELTFTDERVIALGTDTYTMGRDWCHVESWNSTDGTGPVRVTLDREGWRAIEENARKDKNAHGRLEYRPGDCLTFYPGGSGTGRSVPEVATAQDFSERPWEASVNGLSGNDFWDACHDLLIRYDDRPEEIPDVLCFDPGLFGRFQKVKLSKSSEVDKVLDFYYQGRDAPMLAKVGPTFTGLIMPINRSKYAASQEGGGEALWD